MRREVIHCACWWHSSPRHVFSKCIFGFHCFKFCPLCTASGSSHVSQAQWFLVPALWHCWCCSFCNGAGTEAGTWTVFGSSVAQLDSVDAHHLKHFIVYSVIQLVTSFQLHEAKQGESVCIALNQHRSETCELCMDYQGLAHTWLTLQGWSET